MRIRRVVTTRAGGASVGKFESFNLGDHVGDDPAAVAANRKRLAAELGLTKIAWMEQVHGRTVTVVDGTETAPAEATDALVTATPGVAVVVLVADCVPVLLGDAEAGVVAAVHAGRVGARIGVLPAALKVMQEVGAELGRIEVLLGPAICGEDYEVPAEMARDVEKHLPGSATRTRKGTPGLDLRAGLWRQLADAGVGKIGVDPRCTFEEQSLFSYRRDGTTGRIAALTWTEPE
ncbi:peptidoglycan editing factor PgeF [Amycolatopsis acidiphila]|uniref:Purine nucleoside phosphorylase n=1 Tax=Amycolatopsis acidiphila TaxID=715473 RepID=A0A558ABG9_9PSEU|nr:peptidoglycan editing factor PgeF [Amycolatopsis acidiphila]TVT21593.1 peptidoglycan editing factor PgeF [Amycolatopsis acidiphila]UIJ62156.1 peptidoglycan editing factor PgeF [Amycolatopsis acidiphila]GHG92165.1 laccase domain protein [Amycolatopsis acidiphila]